jgi:hypothetical protein
MLRVEILADIPEQHSIIEGSYALPQPATIWVELSVQTLGCETVRMLPMIAGVESMDVLRSE